MEKMIKEASDAVMNYAATSTRKLTEFNTGLFQDWVEFNKTLWEMSPAKAVVNPWVAPKK